MIGNIVGSNIANIGLILGLAAAITVIKTREEMVKRDGYIMLFAALVLYLVIINGVISRVEAALFLLLYGAYILFLVKEKPKFKGEYGFKTFITYFFKFEYLRTVLDAIADRKHNRANKITSTGTKPEESRAGLIKDAVMLTLGGLAVIAGAHYLIAEAVFFAEYFLVSKTLIGVTLVAVGTSLPELSVSVSAARQGYGDIAVANVIGSNIANICFILGVSAFIFPIAITKQTLVFLAPFMRGVGYERIKQLMQMMFFEYTQAYVARGGQLVFSNIQVQPGVPELWRKVPAVMQGKIGPDLYGDFEDEVRLMFRALNEVALKGDFRGKPFNFPKLENSLSPEFFKPEYDEVWLDVHKVVAKFGTPYFDNLLPPYRGYGKGVSCYQCCAYCFVETPESSPDFQEKMNFVNGKHFTMGSWQVVSLNLPRIAYKAKGNDEALFEEARRLMDLSVEIFRIKRKWMDLIRRRNRIPFATQRPIDPRTGAKGEPAIDFDGLVNTIGLVGGNEMAQWHTGYQLHENQEAVKILVKLILEMQKYKKELESRTGGKLALARTPAESTAQRFAVADLLTPAYHDNAQKLAKGDLGKAEHMLIEGEKDVPVYYNNGTHVYVGANVGLLDRMEIEQKFFPLLNGGNMFHAWLGEAHPDPEALYKLTKRIATQTHVGYYAYTRDLTICNSCGTVSPLMNKLCPNCGSSSVEWWSRVTGYYQAVSGWNEGKRQELQDRFRVVV